MTIVDQFESVFRSAVKDVYLYRRIEFASILVVTDFDKQKTELFVDTIRQFIKTLHMDCDVTWHIVCGHDFTTTQDLLDQVEQTNADLIVSYRNLHSRAWKYPHSLGEHLDVLINKTTVPVLIIPNPHSDYAHDHAMLDTNVVMAMTDHLANDHELVNFSVRFTETNGNLILVHIEDEDTFNHYMEVISKIPTIDTEDAKEKIHDQLLKEPQDYIRSISTIIKQHDLPIHLQEIVQFGHHLTEFRKYINEYKVDLLVINTKNKQQMAMHGLAYPLAVELRQIPLLMV